MYSSFFVANMLLIEVLCLVGKVFWSWATKPLSTVCNLGIERSLPAPLTTLFSAFSNIFQSFIVLGLDVANLRYFPCGLSHYMAMISS